MDLTENLKNTIDGMDYTSMLKKWRNSPVGSPMFQGESGDYFAEVMKKKREEVGNAEHIKASKNIGWEG